MKKLLLKCKNLIAKLFLTILGFTLAASQCLAQYMAYVPRYVTLGKLKGITDTISRFRIVVNNYDTLQTDYQLDYSFYHSNKYPTDSLKVEVSQFADDENQQYEPVTETFAIKPKEERNSERELTIKLKKK